MAKNQDKGGGGKPNGKKEAQSSLKDKRKKNKEKRDSKV
jgi:hypothetical protein